MAEHGQPVWGAVEGRMGELLEVSIAMIHELFARYETMPFGLEQDAFVKYAMGQF